MPTKNVPVKVKATAATDGGLEDGQFTALASVFGNIDDVGDIVKPGAFTEDLAAWKSSGAVIPLYWSHRMDDPRMCIGAILDATESDTGLEVKAQLDVDTDIGGQVYRLLKTGRVTRMSFAYDVLDGGLIEVDGLEAYELRKLKIHEVSVVQVPANPEATVMTVKESREASKRRRTRIKAAVDADAAALLGQADQAIDDAVLAVAAADDALDAVLSMLDIPDAPDQDTDADDTGKERAAARKAGRVLSAKNEATLRAAMDQNAKVGTAIKVVLDAIGNDEDKASLDGRAKTDEPDGAKVDEPADDRGSAMDRLPITGIELIELDAHADMALKGTI